MALLNFQMKYRAIHTIAGNSANWQLHNLTHKHIHNIWFHCFEFAHHVFQIKYYAYSTYHVCFSNVLSSVCSLFGVFTLFSCNFMEMAKSVYFSISFFLYFFIIYFFRLMQMAFLVFLFIFSNSATHAK